MIEKNLIKTEAIKYYGRDDFSIYFSPGRVNLIGEHLDYNAGHVFPCALDLGNTFCVALSGDREVRLYSKVMSDYGEVRFSLDDIKLDGYWGDYIRGAILLLRVKGYEINEGFVLYMDGDLPAGGGLSSSASLASGILTILSDLYQLNLSKKEIAVFAKEIENEYIGVSCGIMDSYAIVFSRKDYALFLDTQALEHEHVPLFLQDHVLIISNTNKKRALRTSEYNSRREACERVSALLGKPLAKASLQELMQIKDKIDEESFKRARYVIAEEERTLQAKDALQANDIERFCKLLNESHAGLRDDFEVTGKELDTMCALALKYGAQGSRMTGAGFGGCTVSIVAKDKVDDFLVGVTKEYTKEIGYEPSHYIVTPEMGVSKLED